MTKRWIPGSAKQACKPLAEMFRKRDVESVQDDDGLRFPAHPVRGLKAEAYRGYETVLQLDVRLTLEDNRTVNESVAGVGREDDKAITDALESFERTSFPVFLAAFFNRPGSAERYRWEIAGRKRQAFVGPVTSRFFGLLHDEGGKPDLRFFHAFVALLKASSLSEGTHWVRLYQVRGNEAETINEVLLDNDPWPEMQAAIDEFDWPKRDNGYEARVFLVIHDVPG